MKSKPAKKVAKTPPAAPADWTILVYMAGDNNLNDFGESDMLEMKKAGSNARLNILVQRDTSAAGIGTLRYRLCKGTTLEADVIANLGETNTGDPAVLESFLKWGLKTYPAKRTMAVLWNHGAGWDDTDIYEEARRRQLRPVDARPSGGDTRRSGVRGRVTLPAGFVKRSAAKRRFRGSFFLTSFKFSGTGRLRRAIAFDDDAQDFLDSVEMKRVFLSATRTARRKFDVIGMDACLMSMVETGLQVKDAGDVFCGSQEVEPGEGWPYDRILTALNATPAMDGKALASLIVKSYGASYPKSEPVTQSAFDLGTLPKVAKATDALGTLLTKALRSKNAAAKLAIFEAQNEAQTYETTDYRDLWDFCRKLAAKWPDCATAAKAVTSAVESCVFANLATHADVKQSRGLSIYLPLAKVSPLYHNLDFGKGGWAGFIEALRGGA